MLLSRFNANPAEVHWDSDVRVLRYLRGITRVGMLYPGYCDASHATCPNTGKDRIGYVSLSAGAAIAWGSKRVGNASLRSCETEYMGLTMAAQEASLMIRLKWEMDGVSEEKDKVRTTVVVLTDNHSVMSLAENTVYHC